MADPIHLLQRIDKDLAIYTAVGPPHPPVDHSLPFQEIPKGFLQWGEEGALDLMGWHLLVTDSTLQTLSLLVVAQKKAAAAEEPTRQGPLRSLNTTKCQALTDAGMQALFRVCFSLEKLFLGKTVQLTDVTMAAISEACPNLQSLNLKGSTCKFGEGLTAIGAGCSMLVELCLSACKYLDKVTLLKLLATCSKLTVLEVAGLHQVDDDVLRSVAKRCPQLKKLDVTECEQVSDAGVLALSHGCHDLECLFLGRSAPPYAGLKITDVALLALGERCQALQELVLTNCIHLTDGGLHWLTESCKQLRKLDLENCSKVTNAGIRTLAEVCHQLTWLSLKGARLVSDVGVRHLAQGCKGLVYLDLTGLYLLSDGKNRSFGVEGVQALCQGCQKLKTLHLSDCPQLVDIALKSIAAGLGNLKRLVLANNSKMVEAALVQIATRCPFLVHLDVRYGGIAVTDKVLIAVGQNCSLLKTLIATNCASLSFSALKALATGCLTLETLHLEGCTALDDLAILRLTEGQFKPGLRHLFLDDCTKLTDVALSWLAEACPTLLTVSIKGTKISNGAMEAVKHAWPFSALFKEGEVRGFFPIDSALERLFILEQAKSWHAVIKIQSLLRKVREKQKVATLKRDLTRERAAMKIQNLFLRVHDMAVQNRKKVHAQRTWNAALIIQCMVRRWQASRRLAVERENRVRRMEEASATQIQKAWRDAQACKDARKQRRDLQEQVITACRIQKLIRGYLARQRLRRQAMSSAVIQRLYRGCLARLQMQTLQQKRHMAAVCIQHRVRDYLASLHLYRQELRNLLLWSAHVCFYVCKLENHYLRRKQRQQEYQDQLLRSTILIQRIFRGFLARERVLMLLWERQRHGELVATLESWATVRIQCFWRRVVARRRVEQRRWEYKVCWKELVDEVTQRPFFYNRFTGAIRRQRPKSLLELLPHPRCDRCRRFEAAVECATCPSYLCNACSQRAHSSGMGNSGVLHLTRYLYDFYHKRIDYHTTAATTVDGRGGGVAGGMSPTITTTTTTRWPSQTTITAR